LGGRTGVVFAPRLSTVRSAVRFVVLDSGRLVEEGSHETLMRRPGGVYRSLVEMQAFEVPGASELRQRDAG
ncbi:MAG: ABC transporter ATP-binding protein, partial [Myxococcota bacterium]|nr:ABC transporter ATP-binding protein [Myxococcota bacterium]